MSLKDEYLAIKGNREAVTADEIVRWAAINKESDWHNKLEWNDERAGHSFRVWQVRQLLAIHIKKENVREIISLSIDRKTGGGYRLIDEVVASAPLRQIMINDALAELVRVRDKHRHLSEFAKVWAEIDLMADSIKPEQKEAV